MLFRSLLDPATVESMPSIRSWINHAEVARLTVAENWPDESEDARLRLITEQNVVAQLVHLRTHPAVASRLVGGRVRLHGWVYELHSGTVRAYDDSTDSFVPVEELANR